MTNDAPAYVASPPTGTGLPVLLPHTWWGLNQPIQDLADAYVGHFADNDEFVNSEAELQTATERGEAHVYPGMKHWFMEDDRPEYDAAATELACARTVEFLRQHLA